MTEIQAFGLVAFFFSGLLGVALMFAFLRIADLRQELEFTRGALGRAQGDLYQLQDQVSEAFRLLGLEWRPGARPGWRKP